MVITAALLTTIAVATAAAAAVGGTAFQAQQSIGGTGRAQKERERVDVEQKTLLAKEAQRIKDEEKKEQDILRRTKQSGAQQSAEGRALSREGTLLTGPLGVTEEAPAAGGKTLLGV